MNFLLTTLSRAVHCRQLSLLALLLATILSPSVPSSYAAQRLAVVVGKEAPEIEQFAASELQKILARLSGSEVAIAHAVPQDCDVALFVGDPKSNPSIRSRFEEKWPQLSEQEIWLQSVKAETRRGVIVAGGSPQATLWASYELGYQLGVRYLLREDIYPEPSETLALNNIQLRAKPNFVSRGWRTINDFAIGPESWSLAEHKRTLGQLAKFRFNHVMLAVYPWQPFIHYKLNGVPKQTAMLWYGDKFEIPRGSPGRNALQGISVFENPEFAGKASYDEMVAAGRHYVNTIIADAKRLGMTTGIAISPLEFPREFQEVIPGAQPARGLNQLTVMPGPTTRFDDPRLLQIIAARIHAYVLTYDGLDALYLSLPEFPEWEGFAEEAWQSLATRNKLNLPPLENLVQKAQKRNIIASGERGKQALRGNVVALAMLDLLMEKHPGLLEREDDSRVQLVVRSVDPELYPLIDKLIPQHAATLNFVDYTARRVDENSAYLGDIPTDKVSSRFIATLADDNVGTLSQVTTRRLASVIDKLDKHGWDGFTTRYWMLAELDPTVHYLSRAAWNPDVTARSAHDELFTAITGKPAAAERLWLALGHIEKATELIDKHEIGFCFPVSGMFMKHHQAAPAPEWWDEINELYTQAMIELYRTHDASDPRCRKLLFYWAKRSEYVLEYLAAVKAVREAAILRDKGDVDGALEQYGMALEQLYNAIDTLSDVVRDQGDRGLIATLIKFAYVPLLAELEEYESQQN